MSVQCYESQESVNQCESYCVTQLKYLNNLLIVCHETCADIDGTQRIKPIDSADCLTLHLAPPWLLKQFDSNDDKTVYKVIISIATGIKDTFCLKYPYISLFFIQFSIRIYILAINAVLTLLIGPLRDVQRK